MEPQRGDGTATVITHTLAPEAFYFDNPNFRATGGDAVPFKDTTLPVPSRINIANDVSSKFVGRDSAQVATRIAQGCPNTVPACESLAFAEAAVRRRAKVLAVICG